MNLKICYVYTNDFGRHEFVDGLVLSGDLADFELIQIWDVLSDEAGRVYFIPSRLKLPHLSPIKDEDFDSFVNAVETATDEINLRQIEQSDHPWHELIAMDRTSEKSTIQITARDFFTEILKQGNEDKL
jgi:hypothetical protein